jgi:hypothetical protein
MKSFVRSENETHFRRCDYRYASDVSIYRMNFRKIKSLVRTAVPPHISGSHIAYQMVGDVGTIAISKWGNTDGGNFGPLWDPHDAAKRNNTM